MQLTLTSLPFRTTRFRFRAIVPGVFAGLLSGVAGNATAVFLLLVTGGEATGGTYNDGRFTCRPDFVCVAVGVTSDSSELESPARMIPSSSSSPRRRFLIARLAPFVAGFPVRGATAFCCLVVVVPGVPGVVICDCGCGLADAGSAGFGARSITSAAVFVRSIFVGTASAVLLEVVMDGDANDVGVSSKKAEVFILSFHLPFDPASNGDDELHLENGSKPPSPFFTSPFILPVTRAKSSVVAAESFGISTFPVIGVVAVPPGVVDRALQ